MVFTHVRGALRSAPLTLCYLLGEVKAQSQTVVALADLADRLDVLIAAHGSYRL